jgi:hypothetical protein
VRRLYYEEQHDELVAFLKSPEYRSVGLDFRFYMGDVDLSDALGDGDYGVSASDVAWSLSTTIPRRLPKRLRGAPVTLICDIAGASVTVFKGTLSVPVPATDEYSTDLLAATPGAMLDKVALGVNTEYPGRSPEAVIRDALYHVAYYDRSKLLIPEFNTPTLDFIEALGTGFADEATPKSVIDSVLDIIDAWHYDTGYDAGTRVFRNPGTGEGLDVAWQYDTDSHEVFQWTEPTWDNPDEQYAKVVVRRYNEEGDLALWTEAPINYGELDYPPLANQILFISWDETQGTDSEARQRSVNTARSLARGSFSNSPVVAYNPLLEPGDVLTFLSEYEDDTGLYRRVWRSVVAGLSAPFGEGVSTQLDTTDALVLEERLPDPPILLSGVTAGNVVAPPKLFSFDERGLYGLLGASQAITLEDNGIYFAPDESYGFIDFRPQGLYLSAF